MNRIKYAPGLLLTAFGFACGDQIFLEPAAGAGQGGGPAAGGTGGTGGDTSGGGVAGAAMVPGEQPVSEGGGGGAAGSAPMIITDAGASGATQSDGGTTLPALELVPVVSGLRRPLTVTQAPGNSAQLFVVGQPGVVSIVEGGEVLDPPFLDIQDRVTDARNEQGLLGLAFHPEFEKNGLLYVHYSATGSGDGVTSEFRVSPEAPNQVDPGTERVLLTVGQPEPNHNGGHLAFSPEGLLFLGLGDGGGGGDQHGTIGNGQDLQTLLGKLLRIDVNGREVNDAYSIPAGNMGGDALPEIWNYGLRNPWRFSFDRENGDLYIGDVGQGDLEEIDFEPAGTGAGRNYGWRIMEGDRCYNPSSGCNTENLVLPVATYGRSEGVSVTGGFVYRGSAIEGLRGYYIYADYVTGNFWYLRMSEEGSGVGGSLTDNINPDRAVRSISSFGEDNSGELYVSSLEGTIYKIEPRI